MNCKVCGKTSVRNVSISFFRFPKENSRCKDWADRCGLLELFEKHGTLRFYKSFRICSEHFDPNDIVFDGRKKRLLQSAIPQMSLTSKRKFQRDSDTFCFRLPENLCRLCAKESENFTDIFGWRGKLLNLEKKLKHLPQVINENDVLPLKICHECLSKVEQFYNFVMQCTEAENKLRAMIKLNESKNSPQITKSEFECDKDNVPGANTSLKEILKLQDDSTASVPENSSDLYHDEPNDLIMKDPDYLFRVDESQIGQAGQVYTLKKEVDFTTNNFQQDYKIVLESKSKIQTNQSILEENNFGCDVCMESFMDFETLSKHCLTHSPTWDISDKTLKSIYDSFFCTRSFQISQELKKKIRLKRILKCQRVNSPSLESKKWSFREKLAKNTITNTIDPEVEKSHRCNECRKFFRSKASLRQHGAVHSEKRLHACQECGMSFKRKDTLCNHLRIHSGERPFICKVCGFAFKQRGDCVKHEKNHEKYTDTACKKKISKA